MKPPNFLKDDHGQDLLEYGVLLGLITLSAFAAATALGAWVARIFQIIAHL